tara:strand:- start:109 stop:435 length:327 start_codon:yes stop_codon:yes gene_type:complete
MKKPALRNNRFKETIFSETKWTKKSKDIGEYLFRRISIDQSNKELQNTRPMHLMSKLVITSKEINNYVNDYLKMVNEERSTSYLKKTELRSDSNAELGIDFPEYLGHS